MLNSFTPSQKAGTIRLPIGDLAGRSGADTIASATAPSADRSHRKWGERDTRGFAGREQHLNRDNAMPVPLCGVSNA
jgi:hypothetical protein